MHGRISVVSAMVFAMVLGISSIGAACEAVGANKHVGPVTEIDPESGTFKIKDAETGEPMIFQAETGILQGLSVRQQVVVTYKEEKGRMIAVEVRS